MSRYRNVGLTALLALIVTNPLAAQVQFDGKSFYWPGWVSPRDAYFSNNVTREVVTPHLKAAVPHAGGKLKVFFISPRRLVRPCVELCQRFDIEERYALTENRNKFGNTRDPANLYRHAEAQPADVLRDIEDAMAWDPDVVFLHDLTLSILPVAVQEQILAHVVSDEAGLVCWQVRSGKEPGPIAKVLERPTDAAATDAVLNVVAQRMRYRFDGTVAYRREKQTRIVQIAHVDTDEHFSYLHEEDLYAVVGKAVLAVAGRDRANAMQVMIDQNHCRVSLNAGGVENPKLRLDIYDYAAVYRHERAYVADIPLETQIPMPHLKAGPHWAKLTLRSNGAVVDFKHVMFDVVAPVNIGEITLAKEHFMPDEIVQASVSLEGDSLRDYQFVYELIDTYDRVIDRGSAAAEARVDLSGPVDDCLSSVCFLVARLMKDGRTIAEQRTWFTVEQPHIDTEDFHALQWGADQMWGGRGGPTIWGHEQCKRAKAMGIDYLMAFGHTGKGPWPPAMGNLRPYGYAINHGKESEDEIQNGGPVRKPCLTSRHYREDVADRTLRRTAKTLWRYSPLAYTNCGDSVLSREVDVCFSDSCIADFRRYAETRYADIDALNESWDTHYEDFSQVMPVMLSSLENRRNAAEKQAALQNNDEARIHPPTPGEYAHWLEHRLHMESVYANLHLDDADAVLEYDSDAKYGIDAMAEYASAYAGFDFTKLFERVKFFGPYFHPFDYDIGRSLSRPGTILGSWVGGYAEYRTEEVSRLFAWKLLFHGFNMQMFFIYFNQDSASHPCSLIAPDLRPYPTMSEQVEELQEIRRGTGRLLRSADRLNDGIAFLYSPQSVHATMITRGVPKQEFAKVEGVKGKTGMHANDRFEYLCAAEGLQYLFSDMGFQFDYVSPAQVAGGRLSRDRFRMVVLPSAQALSQPVVAAIREFAAEGGIVLADMRPAIFDGHGRFLGKGQLDDVFGIDRPATFPMKPQVHAVVPSGAGAGGGGSGDVLATLAVDHEVAVTCGHALGDAYGTPAFIMNRHEQGAAYLLNFWPGHYVALRTMGREMPLRDFVESMLTDAGLSPQVRITAADGKVKSTEAVRYAHGDNLYVGLLRSPRLRIDEAVTQYDRRPRWATINFGRRGHVYDIRQGKYIAHTDEVEALVAPGRALLYSILPYQVNRIDVSPHAATEARSRRFDINVITAACGNPAMHVLHFSVVDPTGRERPEYARNLKAENGRITTTLRLAFSDAPGRWQVTARDTSTGHIGQCSFEHRPATSLRP